jgi:hypothetical protein
MSKLLKWLILADIAMFALVVLVVLKTRSSNDFSGLLAVYPLIAMAFLTVAILILFFIRVIKGAGTGAGAKNGHALMVSIAILLGVPWLGYYYATHGQNRESLRIISEAAFVIGIVASLALVVRYFQSQTKR